MEIAMILKFFRKSAEVRPLVKQDSTLAEALARRVNAIDFQPSRGFLKDQWQQKRSATAMQLESLDAQRSENFSRRVTA
jgi:hypothetical protein